MEIGAAQYSDPNPNGELDNLYLDMNGIVHPCSHPEHKPAPETEDEMFLDVFKYTERVLMMARPRKVLMIAVDGVAPRAKMNQQRLRRFRLAQEAKIAHEEKERQIRECEARGELIDEAIKGKRLWDSNAITPGTPFMGGLALALRYWVAYKLTSDPGWADLQVIISDATVPGEGEHKIMNFIRSQRLDPEYNPNTRHAIYGLDADLIFLGLATHEPHFRILREDVFANQSRQLRVADQILMSQEQRDQLTANEAKKPFLWLHVNVLREYLEVELFNPRLLFQFDLERAIDDWIFMCFFVGNDFLPHLPSLDVRDNGIDTLVNCWKRVLPRLKGYITCDGHLDLESVETLMDSLTYKEDDILRRKHEQERRRDENDKRRKTGQMEERALKDQYLQQVSKGQDKAPLTADVNMPLLTTSGEAVEGFAQLSNKDIVANRDIITKANMANADAAAQLKRLLAKKNGGEEAEEKEEERTENAEATLENGESNASSESDSTSTLPAKRKLPTPEPNSSGDAVRMWEPGYRDRYYQTKFGISTEEDIRDQRRQVVRSYLEGISWVLLYYYQGCPSWQWYYPYHYAPFAADFVDIKGIVGDGIHFEQGQPFRPYEQLMAVLPAASGHTLPEVFRGLMSDPDSEIIDFYPEDFKIDMNGAKMSWQGVALLPFIDEKRLLTAVQGRYKLLTADEEDRNTNKNEELFILSRNKNYAKFTGAEKTVVPFRFSKTKLAGTVTRNEAFNLQGVTPFPLNQGNMPSLQNNEFLQIWYRMPPKTEGKLMIMGGYISHVKVLTQDDRNSVAYGPQRGGPGPRFRATTDNDYVNNGPAGTEAFHAYSMRRGGYRAFLYNMNNGSALHEQQMGTQRAVDANYGGQGDYGSRGGYGGGRGGYNSGRGDYGGRGGYGRGGYSGRGGYNSGRGGYNSGRGGYNSGRGGYQGNNGLNNYPQGPQGQHNYGQNNYGGQNSYNSNSYSRQSYGQRDRSQNGYSR